MKGEIFSFYLSSITRRTKLLPCSFLFVLLVLLINSLFLIVIERRTISGIPSTCHILDYLRRAVSLTAGYGRDPFVPGISAHHSSGTILGRSQAVRLFIYGERHHELK